MNIHSASIAAQSAAHGKREEILRAALELIAAHGFHDAPIASIAGQAGVGAGTIYRYFENKDILIQALFQEIHAKICATVMAEYGPEQPLMGRFTHLSTTLLRYLIDNPLHFRYIEQFHNSPYGTEFRRERILGKGGDVDPYRALFAEGITQKVLKDLPLAVLFALTFGPLLAVARDHNLGFIMLDDGLILATVQACWDGIKK